MDLGDSGGEAQRRTIPADLPTSLDDRRHAAGEFTVPETEMYDGWQGAFGVVLRLRLVPVASTCFPLALPPFITDFHMMAYGLGPYQTHLIPRL